MFFYFVSLPNYKIIVFDIWGIDTVIVIKIPLVPFPEVMCIKFLSNNNWVFPTNNIPPAFHINIKAKKVQPVKSDQGWTAYWLRWI